MRRHIITPCMHMIPLQDRTTQGCPANRKTEDRLILPLQNALTRARKLRAIKTAERC